MPKLELRQQKVTDLVSRVSRAIEDRRKIFYHNVETHLPQYNIPQELEYSPKRQDVKDPESAGRFLYLRNQLDRRYDSIALTRFALEVWSNPEYNWIFNPREVVKKSIADIDKIIRNCFHNGLTDAAPNILHNSKILNEKYDSDPRNLLKNLTMAESKERMMELKGIGTGLANLLQIQLMERRIALPIDVNQIKFKVDVWKGSLIANVGAVKTDEYEIRSDVLIPLAEKAYWKACKKLDLDWEQVLQMDGALWVIGSQICKINDKQVCERDCPLHEVCKKVRWNDKATTYMLKEEDPRKDDGQSFLPFNTSIQIFNKHFTNIKK